MHLDSLALAAALGSLTTPAVVGQPAGCLVTCLAVGETPVVVIVQEYEDESGRAWTAGTERLLAMLAATFEVTAGS